MMLVLGVLWLLLAAALVVTQLTASPEIEIAWTTETEYATAGFNIYRSESADGEFMQINQRLIPSQGDPATGASYSYRDRDIEPGQPYFYKLEEVEYDNARQLYDISSSAARALIGWMLALALISALIGAFLLLFAMKQQRALVRAHPPLAPLTDTDTDTDEPTAYPPP